MIPNYEDKEIFDLIEKEKQRQNNVIDLIASENYASNQVMKAVGSVLTNKYAEGYPSARYYGGCENIDEVEKICIERLKKIFGAEHVNVQPHSGSQANIAVYLAFLKPGDKILSMDLKSGGHLSHGLKTNFSGRIYEIHSYGIDEKGFLDYEAIRKQSLEIKPRLIIAGASAYSREIDFKKFREIADECNSLLMVDMAHIAGLVAAGIHNSPIPYADFVTSTTHKTLRGPRGGIILCKEKYSREIDSAIFPGSQGGPLMNTIAGKAVCFYEALLPEFKIYQEQIVKNAKALSSSLLKKGFNLVSGGTDNHLILIDLRNLNLTGKEAEDLLGEAGIIVNKNAIVNDPQPPRIASGIRIGTPSVTTRGMKEAEMELIADFMEKILKKQVSPQEIREKTLFLCTKFNVY